METKTFSDILVDVKAEALLDTLGNKLLNAEAETLEVKMGNVEAKAVAYPLKEVASASFNINLGDVHSEAPGHNLIVTVADAEAKTFSDILSNLEAETCAYAN